MYSTHQLRKVSRLLAPVLSKQKFTLLLLAMSVFGCLLLSMRIILTEDFYFLFLPWNLFLAWLPFLLSSRIYKNGIEGKSQLKILPLWILWFLFYPNAPYIITDLVHLGSNKGFPGWYDSLLVFSFALTGLLVGLASLYQIHRVIENFFGRRTGWIFIVSMLLATGFGIYIGRILRWNSWDLFVHTIPLMADVRNHFFSSTAMGVTFLFSAFTGIAYLFLFFLMHVPAKKMKFPSTQSFL